MLGVFKDFTHQVLCFLVLCPGTCYLTCLKFPPYFFTPYRLSLRLSIISTVCFQALKRPIAFPSCLQKPLANYSSDTGFFKILVCLLYLTTNASKAGIFSDGFWLSQGPVWCSGYHSTQWKNIIIFGHKIILCNLFSFPQIIIGKSWFKSHSQAKTNS